MTCTPRRLLLLAVCGIVLLAGCEDTVIDPFANDERYYTVYGYLDVLETEHTLRVVPITRQSGVIQTPADPAADIDAVVTTTELSSGQSVRWVHGLEELDDGTYAHIFRATFRVEQDRTYRLEITRSDGVVTWAETHVPYIAEAALFDRAPIDFGADSTHLSQEIRMPGIASPWAMEAMYIWGGGDINHRVYVPYGRVGERTTDGDWVFELTITEDQPHVRANVQGLIDIGRISAGTLGELKAMGLRLRILDDRWDPPEGVFDPEVLARPDGLSNVVNGYGFFGSMGIYVQEWNTCELSELLGYWPAGVLC